MNYFMKKFQSLILACIVCVSLSSCETFLQGMAAGMGGYGYGMGYMPGYGGVGGGNMDYLLDPRYAMMQVAQQQAQMNAVNQQIIQTTVRQVNEAEQAEYQAAKKYRPNLTLEQFRREKAQAYQNTTSSGSSTTTDYQQRKKETLNRTVGENCLSCKGSGKCSACNGTKVAHGFGNTYKCNVCNEHGDCPVCHGTGKTSWNR